jgi:cytoskeletal protein CcmA (bactofilin family)
MSGPPPPPRKRRPQEHVDNSRQQEQDKLAMEQEKQQKQQTLHALYASHGLTGRPETLIGKGVRIEGELLFERFLRIDGTFTGNLQSTGCVVIGETGAFVGDMRDMRMVLLDGGSVNGNIWVDSVAAINGARIVGSVTCKQFSCDSNVYINGRVNIHHLAPEVIDSNGEIMVDIDDCDDEDLRSDAVVAVADEMPELEDGLVTVGDDEGSGALAERPLDAGTESGNVVKANGSSYRTSPAPEANDTSYVNPIAEASSSTSPTVLSPTADTEDTGDNITASGAADEMPLPAAETENSEDDTSGAADEMLLPAAETENSEEDTTAPGEAGEGLPAADANGDEEGDTAVSGTSEEISSAAADPEGNRNDDELAVENDRPDDVAADNVAEDSST